MALIEQIEKQELKLAFKNLWTYFLMVAFALPIYFSTQDYNLYILVGLAIVFAIIFVIDVKEYIIPDTCQLATFILANILIYFSPERNFVEAYIGFAFSGLIFASVYYVGEKILKKSILGFGDVKLFAVIGLLLGFFGFNYFLWVLTIFSGVFVILRKTFTSKKGNFPFGPFIVVSAWICLLFTNYFDVINYKLMSSIY